MSGVECQREWLMVSGGNSRSAGIRLLLRFVKVSGLRISGGGRLQEHSPGLKGQVSRVGVRTGHNSLT